MDETIEGYRGQVEGLKGRAISSFDIREDGRYLFYTQGGSNFGVIDLQDFVTGRAFSVPTSSSLVGLHLLNENRLAAVGSSRIEYFDVRKVFEVELENEDFRFPVNSNTRAFSSCLTGNSRIFVLEEHQSNAERHILRSIDEKKESGRLNWNNLITSLPGRYVPLGIRCSEAFVFVLSARFDQNPEGDFYIHRVSASNIQNFSSPFDISNAYPDYFVVDIALSPTQEHLLLLLNRINPQNNSEDALAVRMNANNFSQRTQRALGQGAQGISFFRRGGELHYGFFVQTDLLQNVASQRFENFHLRIPAASFVNGDFLEDRGQGLSEVSEERFSKWILPASDHYAFGLIESSGLSLLSSAADIQLLNVSTDQQPLLTPNQPIQFTLTSPVEIEYELRFSEDLPEEGSAQPINTSFGRRILRGSLKAGESVDFSLDAEDLRVNRNKEHSIGVYATQQRTLSEAFQARRGVFFRFDPPPEPVSQFRLSFGDQGVFAFFESEERGSRDLDRFLVYFSYDPVDLENLPRSNLELVQWREAHPPIMLLNGKALPRPIEVNAKRSLSARVAIGPIPNDQELFVRVQVVDDSGQFSSDNPEALSMAPLATRTLPGALGSPESCQLGTDVSPQVWFALGLIFILLMRQRRDRLQGKKNGPSV